MFGTLRKWFKREPASWHQVDRLYAALETLPKMDFPLTHSFTPGLYSREVFAPKGSLIVTKIHKTEHPFIMLTGAARVWTDQSGVLDIQAPYVGVTKPGTRRVVFVTEDCRWITFHATKETDVEKIEANLTIPRDIKKELAKHMTPGLLKEAL